MVKFRKFQTSGTCRPPPGFRHSHNGTPGNRRRIPCLPGGEMNIRRHIRGIHLSFRRNKNSECNPNIRASRSQYTRPQSDLLPLPGMVSMPPRQVPRSLSMRRRATKIPLYGGGKPGGNPPNGGAIIRPPDSKTGSRNQLYFLYREGPICLRRFIITM